MNEFDLDLEWWPWPFKAFETSSQRSFTKGRLYFLPSQINLHKVECTFVWARLVLHKVDYTSLNLTVKPETLYEVEVDCIFFCARELLHYVDCTYFEPENFKQSRLMFLWMFIKLWELMKFMTHTFMQWIMNNVQIKCSSKGFYFITRMWKRVIVLNLECELGL